MRFMPDCTTPIRPKRTAANLADTHESAVTAITEKRRRPLLARGGRILGAIPITLGVLGPDA